MPRYGKRREFQLGEYWLDRRAGSPAWYRCWNEGRQVRRVSLGTDDLQQAKRLLNEWYAANFQAAADDLPPSKVKLSVVLLDYWNGQASKLRTHETAKIMLRYWQEWWADATVADVRDPAKQDAFRAHLFGKGLAHNSVNRCLEAGRAAIRRAWKRGVISSAPFIQMLPAIETKPMGRPLSKEEAWTLYHSATQPHIRHFILLALGTGARPEAITELTWDRVDFAADLITLNPTGRVQTKKYRPTLRMPPTLKAVLKAAHAERQGEHVIMFRGRSISRLDTGWDKAVTGAGLDKRVTLYSLRHTVARHLRSEGVDGWEVSAQLGHKRPGLEMSERYTGVDPSYQREAVASLDRLLVFVLAVACQLPDTHLVRLLSASVGHDAADLEFPLISNEIEGGRGGITEEVAQ